MDMPRTREQLQQAADAAERWLDSLDPAAIASPDADASSLRRIGDAVCAVARSQVELADAVSEARATDTRGPRSQPCSAPAAKPLRNAMANWPSVHRGSVTGTP